MANINLTNSSITSIGQLAFAYISTLTCVYYVGSVITSASIFYQSNNYEVCGFFSPTLIPSVISSLALTEKPSIMYDSYYIL